MTSLSISKNKMFYHTLSATALPIIIQNAISSSLNLVDNVMIGRLGATSIAAVGLANQLFFIMTLVLFGTYSGISIFISQYWGNKSYDKLKEVMVVGLTIGMFVTAFFFAIACFLPRQFLMVLSEDSELVAAGTTYLQIVSFSYLLTSISYAFGISTRGIGKAKLPMKASIISLAINTCLNAVLIFGLFGFEALGVKGAAIATLIARTVEFIIILKEIYGGIPYLAVSFSDFKNTTIATYRTILKTALPVILNEGFWAVGMTVYAYVYAHMGTLEMAAIQISNMINNLFYVISIGLGSAAMVMLGNKLGSGNLEEAIDYNRKFLMLGTLSGIGIGILVATLSPFVIPLLFKLTDHGIWLTVKTLQTFAILTPFKFYNTIVIIGTLRSGGDTLFSLFLELGSVWLIGVPMAFISGFYWELPIYYVVGIVGLDEICKAFIGIPRIKSKKWARRLIS